MAQVRQHGISRPPTSSPEAALPGSDSPAPPRRRELSRIALTMAGIVAISLPIVGFVSLLFRSQLDPSWDSHRLHFVLFLAVGGGAVALAYLAGQAADRRGDARVFLLSLAFLVTGGFLAVHAIGTPGILLNDDLPGFKVAIPVGLLIAALFAGASAFVDVRPGFATAITRRRNVLRVSVVAAMGVWIVWTLAELPPLAGSSSEGAGTLLKTLAALGAAAYVLAALRYSAVFRRSITLLPASIIACFILLAEALFGSALVGERTWHASWWEWHGLIVIAYLLIFFAARQQWRDERFRHLYLATTRERSEEVSVLFADLVGSTTFAERVGPAEAARMLSAYYEMATPLITQGFGGEVEKFMGDAIMATFNSHGDQPDHATRAAGAALELQHKMTQLSIAHPEWPKLRVGVNSGEAQVSEMGGHGYLQYAVVGDTINVGSRLQGEAPVGGVLIGANTYRRLPPHTVVETRSGLRVKGREGLIDAFVLHSVPT